jgi:hypothetical protein
MTLALIALATLLSAGIAYHSGSYWNGDYPREAGPGVDALINGHFREFFEARSPIGIVSLLVRAPFAALSHLTGGGGRLDLYDNAYRFGVFPCVLAAGLVAVVLARRFGRRGGSPLLQIALVVAMLLNPAATSAVLIGHPEEILAAAFAIGALLAAIDKREWLSIGLLALAFLTKEWAIVLAAPIAVQLGWRRLRKPLLVGSGVVVALLTPLIIADPHSFYVTKKGLIDIGPQPLNPSLWWFVTHPRPHGLAIQHEMPVFLARWAHPIIIATSVLLTALVARRVREDPALRLMALAAAILMLRAALDPIANRYYHVPFYAAVLAVDSRRGSFIPSVLAFAALLTTSRLQGNPDLLSAFYVVWSLAFVAYYMALSAGAATTPGWLERILRTRVARGQAAAPQAHLSSSGASTPPAR